MANRFWVGNGGNIDDTAHWSATSGGAGGATVPTSSDLARFDSLSFTLAGQTVTMNNSISCLGMDWTGVTNNPTFAGSQAFDCYDSLTFVAPGSMTISITGNVSLRATSTGKTFTSAGQTLTFQLNFTGVGAGYTLQDNLTFTGTKGILFQTGTLDTNGKSIYCYNFNGSISNVRTLTLGSSTITCYGATTNPWNMTTITNLTFNPGTSTIIMGTGTIGRIFAGGGLTYNNLRISDGDITIEQNSNTFNKVTVDNGCTLKLPNSGFITTVAVWDLNGVTGNFPSLQSKLAGTTALISKSSGIVNFRRTTIKDIHAQGGATYSAISSTNVSNNTGISFVSQLLIGQMKLNQPVTSLYWTDANGVLQKISG